MRKLLVPLIAGTLLTGCIDQITRFFELPVDEVTEQTPADRYDIAEYTPFKSTQLDNLEGRWVLIYKDMQGEQVTVIDADADIQAKITVNADTLALFTLSDKESDGGASITIPAMGYDPATRSAVVVLTESEGIYTSEDGAIRLTFIDNGRLSGTYEGPEEENGVYSLAFSEVEMVKVNDAITLEGSVNVSSNAPLSIDHAIDFLVDTQGSLTVSKITEGEEEILDQDDGVRIIIASDTDFSYFASISNIVSKSILIENEEGASSLRIEQAGGVEYASDALNYQDHSETALANSESYDFDSVSLSFSGTDITDEVPVDFTLTLDASW